MLLSLRHNLSISAAIISSILSVDRMKSGEDQGTYIALPQETGTTKLMKHGIIEFIYRSTAKGQ